MKGNQSQKKKKNSRESVKFDLSEKMGNGDIMFSSSRVDWKSSSTYTKSNFKKKFNLVSVKEKKTNKQTSEVKFKKKKKLVPTWDCPCCWQCALSPTEVGMTKKKG